MLDVALGLAERGFKVFPLKPGEKTPPLIKKWDQVATSDYATVCAWWERWPQANVGIHCDGMLVLDVDAHKGGMESLAALEKEIELEATFEVETPRGGRHIYYRCPAGVRNGVDVLGPGLDVRSTAGYVVAPGSRVSQGEYRVIADEPIADVLPGLVERASARRPREVHEVAVETDVDAAVQRAVDYLRTHPVADEGSGGDHHTFRTVCRIRDFGVPEGRAAEALEEWNGRCSPPWEPEELAVKIQNAYTYAQDAPGKLTPEAMGFVDETDNVKAIGEPKPDNAKVIDKLGHPARVKKADVVNVAYHIKGVLEEQSDIVAFGAWSVGKTFVILDMMACIACNLPWFGKRVRQGRVLYFGYEGQRALEKRMVALREKYPLLQDEKTPFAYHSMTDPLTMKSGFDEMTAAIAQFVKEFNGAPTIIIIDTLAAALGGDDSDADKMAELNRVVKGLIKKKFTVLRVHHSGHSNQDRARGHSSLPAGIDTEIRIDKQEIALTKQRDDVKSKVFFRLKVVPLDIDTDGDQVTTCVVEQIESNPLSPELSGPQKEFLDALVNLRGEGGAVTKTEMHDCAPEDFSPGKKRELIAALEKKQYLRQEGKVWIICERGPMAMFD